jgi:SAM-dependent methyltransferase
MGVPHHVSDPRPMVDENHRVLKPSGRLIAMLYHRYSWKNLVLMRLLFSPAYRGKSQQEAVNMNDGPNCPLALVYSRREAEALFHRFGNLRFDVNQLSWQQLFILPSLGARAARLLGPADRSSFAQLLGWTLYVRGVES